ncbi:hypothetical protein SNE40_017969 [Patella caerulea]|uniref:Uncharacterized protein n=1 Tax=Patella caerulea TaxID=87958 RepID=A0AAN8PGS7_PATCE
MARVTLIIGILVAVCVAAEPPSDDHLAGVQFVPLVHNPGYYTKASFLHRYVNNAGVIAHTKSGGSWVTISATTNCHSTALDKAALVVSKMVRHMPSEIFTHLATSHGVGIFSAKEGLTVYPEYSHLRDTPSCHGSCSGSCAHTCTFDGRKYESLGGLTSSISAVVDDNVICDAQDKNHHHQNTLVHEFGHLVNHYMPSQYKSQITAAYNHAKSNNLWNNGQYAMATIGEYWAEATASFFLSTVRTDVTGGLNMCGGSHVCSSDLAARQYIAKHDPMLYKVLNYVYTHNNPNIPGTLKPCV